MGRVGVAELCDRVKFWAALWASTSLAFKDVPYPSIMPNLLAVSSGYFRLFCISAAVRFESIGNFA
ncbi:Protein of unknown function D [Prunus dulcis]|uniref:Uncharacterized protein n=1 Tax=Prunus dulcis TaxID=3755 RepID=A0A4Y1RWB9_PRUDU|nr:Protein of unknown function D [Prunus dulcis]